MDWHRISFDWNQVRAFLAAVEEGSFTGAARVLGLSQPTLGRQVAGLETDLGVTLFERVGRVLVLTDAGQSLLDAVREMRDAAARVSLAAAAQSQTVSGLVRISASDAVSAYLLPRILDGLAQLAPGVEIEVIASNELSDLRRREADIAIRHQRPSEPDLIARLVRESQAQLYATAAYLDRHGLPSMAEGLGGALILGIGSPERLIGVLRDHGLAVNASNFRHFTENTVAAWQMVRQGMAIGIMMEEIAALTPEVRRILPDFRPIPVPIWLTTHRELKTSRRIRMVYDFLAEELARPELR